MQYGGGDAHRPIIRPRSDCDGDRGAEGLLIDDISLLDTLADNFVDSQDSVLQMLLDNFGSPEVGQRPTSHMPGSLHHHSLASYQGGSGGGAASSLRVTPQRPASFLAANETCLLGPPHASLHSGPSLDPAPTRPSSGPSYPALGGGPGPGGGFIPTPSVSAPPPSAFAGSAASMLGLTGSPRHPHSADVGYGGKLEPSGSWSPSARGALLSGGPRVGDTSSGLELRGSGQLHASALGGGGGGGGLGELRSGGGSGSWSLCGQAQQQQQQQYGRVPQSSSGQPLARPPPTFNSAGGAGPAAARPPVGGSAAPPSAAPPNAAPPSAAASKARADRRRSLLLRVFNGMMRPEVAALAAAAAQRACVTDPTVRPGLYFTVAQPVAAPGGPGAAVGPGAAARAGGVKRGAKDKLGTAGSTVLAADPFARLYPEASEELLAALYGARPLPKRVRVESIHDRCHPCFRNPFGGLASVSERRKLVACGPVPDGGLLGPYLGELRSGRMDERLVGGDLSGVEGLKAAFTLTLIGDLEPPPPSQHQQQSLTSQGSLGRKGLAANGGGGGSGQGGIGGGGPGGGPDCIVCVGDPAVCPLAEANAPRFWGPCSSVPAHSAGLSNLDGCNCRAYQGREANAAVVPVVFKVRLSRLRSAVEAEEAEDAEELREGLEALKAAAAVAAPQGGAGAGGIGNDANTFVYGIVAVVVTSRALQDGIEVLLRWDDDDSFFSVAEQNLRQYQHIQKLISERKAAEAKHSEQRREVAQLRKEKQEALAAHEAAQVTAAEALRNRDDALRQLDELLRERDDILRQRDEAVRQRDATAAGASAQADALAARHVAESAAAAVVELQAAVAAKDTRVMALERVLATVEAERNALRAQLAQGQQGQGHQQQQQQQEAMAGRGSDGGGVSPGSRQQPPGPSVRGAGPHHDGASDDLHSVIRRLREERDEAVRHLAALERQYGSSGAAAASTPAGSDPVAADGPRSSLKRRPTGHSDQEGGGGGALATAVGEAAAKRLRLGSAGTGDTAGTDPGTNRGAELLLADGSASPAAAATAALMLRYSAAQQQQDQVVSELVALVQLHPCQQQRQQEPHPRGRDGRAPGADAPAGSVVDSPAQDRGPASQAQRNSSQGQGQERGQRVSPTWVSQQQQRPHQPGGYSSGRSNGGAEGPQRQAG